MRPTPSVRRAGQRGATCAQTRQTARGAAPRCRTRPYPTPSPHPPPEVGSHGYAGSAYLLQLAEPPTDSSPYASAVTSKYLRGCARPAPSVREYPRVP
jgi:hypothetical protein